MGLSRIVSLPPSWFVTASASWGECLNFQGGREWVRERRKPTRGSLGSLDALFRWRSRLQTKMAEVRSKRASLKNPAEKQKKVKSLGQRERYFPLVSSHDISCASIHSHLQSSLCSLTMNGDRSDWVRVCNSLSIRLLGGGGGGRERGKRGRGKGRKSLTQKH